MSLILKENGIYHVDFSINNRRIRKSTKTADKEKAKFFLDKLKAESWFSVVDPKMVPKTFDQAVEEFLIDCAGQADYVNKKRHAEYFLKFFRSRKLSTIKKKDIFDVLPTGVKNATKNRYLATVQRIFSIAFQNEWIVKVPYLPKFHEKKVNFRFLTKPEFENFIGCIRVEWMWDICLFAVLTGLRANEIFSLTWDKIDFDRKMTFVSFDLSKSGRARAVPLNDMCIRLLKKRHSIKKSSFVFCRDSGIKLKEIDRRILNRARLDCGIEEHFTFHDLRHTWASWHVQSGTPLMVLKELGGWESVSMVQKYAHLDASHLSRYADKSMLNMRM
ncbi:MAG: site-specific integrase [Acholeplasmataceae bacterium]|nr:site-specific integrase [Acholeplasmataceae bacterium]